MRIVQTQSVISNAKAAIIAFLIVAVFIGPVFHTGSVARADGQASLFEVIVSPVGDPDPRDETSIAVSPINDRMIVGASKVILGGGTFGRGDTRVAYYFSSDGGHSWGTGLHWLETPEKTWGRATYPTAAADLNGNFYLCVLMLDNSSFDTGVYVFKSTDNGQTFTNPSPAVVDIVNGGSPRRADKCSMTVDASQTSPFKNSVYVVWTSTGPDERGQNSTVVRFARRRAGDAGFTESKAIGHAGDMRGPSVTAGPNGEVYAAWVGMPARVLLFNASSDGGDTFLPGLASLDINIHNYVGNLEGPNASFFISGLERANSFPTLDVDRSNGPNRGIVYVAWAESVNRIDTDIFLCRVTPQAGQLPDVSLPVRVNDNGNGTDQFFPSLAVDSSSGAVAVAFYDRRDSPGSVLMNLYLARSTDGGASFGENTRVTPVSSDPRVQAGVLGTTASAIGIGDYIGAVAARGKTHVMWADTRHGKQEIFYSQLDFGSSPPPPPPDGMPNDQCENPRAFTSLPYLDSLDTTSATSSAQDPASCTGSQDTNSVWYAFAPAVSSTYGIDTTLSDYDTVVSVHTGGCGSLVRTACSDDFGNPPGRANRGLLTFPATAGVTYLIEVSGKGSGGLLRMQAGYPTITGVEYTTGPDDSKALRITGAGFLTGNVSVTVQLDGEDIALPNIFSAGPALPDGTETAFFASKKKLKKLVKRGSLLVKVESPAGSGKLSNSFLFAR
jgi:hypothetical protein